MSLFKPSIKSEARTEIKKSLIVMRDNPNLKDDEQQRFAQWLLEHQDQRTECDNVLDEVLDPSPIKILKEQRTNQYVDIGMGISAFWEELQDNPEELFENATILENALLSVNIGLDNTVEPDIRRQALSVAQIPSDTIDTIVPITMEPIDMEQREKIIEDFNLQTPLEPHDEDFVRLIEQDERYDAHLINPNEVPQLTEKDIWALDKLEPLNEPPQLTDDDLAILDQMMQDTDTNIL